MFAYTALCFAFLSLSQAVFAWGPEGQTVTVAIAERYLTPTAKAQIAKIMNGVSLQSVATWADQAKNGPEWGRTASWHYVDRRDTKSHGYNLNEPADVRDAIAYSQEKLESQLNNAEKVTWLKFLIHFVGDLHQPMHVGNPDDRGGNQTKVSYRGKTVNLHALWDSSFIDEQRLDVNAYVQKLVRQSRPLSHLNETYSSDVVINENFQMRKFLYSFKGSSIDEGYASKAREITDERLWSGGMRLAAVLNEIFK